MNFTPKPAPWNRPRFRHNKPREGTPGGEYLFVHKGQTYSLPGRFLQDPESPDGMRWIGTPDSNRTIRKIVYELAGRNCELRLVKHCWGWAPVHLGHPHHVILKGMGGANTEDRIWLADGTRVRVWACPNCHRFKHGEPELEWIK